MENQPQPDERSETEKLYDTAYEYVKMREDQGIDSVVAWYDVDPTGRIQRNYALEQEQKEQQRQDTVNHTGAEVIRQAAHVAKMAEIERIDNPEERARAKRELLARERMQNERRGRRY